jgi:PPOX class probable FMN-dependent enzyme
MDAIADFAAIETVEDLEALYGVPGEASTAKVSDRITPEYRRLIEASPFLALATAGPEGLDCSPRGDQSAALTVRDDKTLLLPDRRGNNRIDSLRNIVRNPRVALLCLIPGSGTTLRINGTARLTADPGLLERFAVDGKAPRTVIVITVAEIYFQCARAVLRSELWNPARQVDPKTLPTPGDLLHALTDRRFDGRSYDREWPERARK